MTTPDSRLSLLFDVHRVAYLTDELVERALDDQELTGTEFALYSYLKTQGPRTISEVAAGMAASVATASKLLGRVEERGHLMRKDNPADGRSTLVDLNDAGRAAHTAARPGFRTALTAVQNDLGAAIDDIRWALARLDHALTTALDQPAGPEPGSRPSQRTLTYEGDPLSADEETEVRRYIDWLRWQRDADA